MGEFKNVLIIFMLVCINTNCLADRNNVIEYNNVSRALPCPDPVQIDPCICSVDVDMDMYMDCSEVTSEDQLKAIFSTQLPFKDFYELRIERNRHLISLRENDLGEATFKKIVIWNGILEVVETFALIGSASTLQYIEISSTNIKLFPFEEMTLYNKLDNLRVRYSQITVCPKINSTTILQLDLAGNQILELPAGALNMLPNIETFYFSDNPMKDILPGTFTDIPNIRSVDLRNCELTNIPSFTFAMMSMPSYLDLSYNQISDVAVNAITDVTDVLFLEGNKLTELTEEVWLPVMESASYFIVYDNPLLCGCDIAWIILNPTYMAKLRGSETCSDGELLIDLDPAIYENFC